MGKIKPLYLLILLALMAFVFTFGQFSLGQSRYPLPPPSSQLLINGYPEKVKESLKQVIGITVQVSLKNLVIGSFGERGITSSGTGFMFQPGVFVSARHVLVSSMYSLDRMVPSLSFDKNGVPISSFLNYSLLGTTDINSKAEDFKLNVIGMGAADKFEDYMIMQSLNYPKELKPIEYDEKELNIDETVYNAGYVHAFTFIDGDPLDLPTLLDIVRTSFPGRIDAVIKDFPINKRGVSALYRIETKFEQGFSGGPVLNSEGRVVAMTVLRSNNYIYAIPAKDFKLLIEKLKKDRLIK